MNSKQEKISDNAKAFVEGVLLDGGDLSDLMVIAAVVHTAIEKTAGETTRKCFWQAWRPDNETRPSR